MATETMSPPRAEEQPTGGEGAPTPGSQPPHEGGGQEVLSGVSESVVQMGREVLSKEGVRPLLNMTLDALFSESARLAIQKQAEEALRSWLEAALDVIPYSYRDSDLEDQFGQMERTARTLLRESLDQIFNGSARIEVEQHLERALEEALDGTSEAARRQAEQALQSFLVRVVAVFHRHSEQLLRMLLPLIMKVLQQALAAKAKEGLATITSAPREQAERKVSTMEDRLQRKGEEFRRHMADAADGMRQRVGEARDQLQDRLGASLQSAGKGVSQPRRPLGRPPAGPPRHRSLGRPPSQRPPSGPGPRR